MSINTKLAFIGAGKMVSAIVHSLIRSKSFIPKEIACCSAADGTSDKLAKETGILRFDSIEEMLLSSPTVLILGCKPQQIKELPTSIAELSSGCMILSIMAGIPIVRLSKKFPLARNIVRSMPNTPGQIGHGVTGFLFSQSPSISDRELIEKPLALLDKSLS